VTAAVLEIAGVTKDYRGLRPLRLQQLTIAAGEQVAIVGLDAPSAEVFVNLVTGASLPDTGEIRLFDRATAAIVDSADWLATIDRVGIVSERAVLLDPLSVIQNLAIPFTLEIEPPPADTRQLAERLAEEVGLPDAVWPNPVADLDVAGRMRVRLGRALALEPAILLLEHASVGMTATGAAAFGKSVRTIAAQRSAAVVAATADIAFARAVAARVLTLDPATGRLKESARGWFGRLG
jgi:ABC-type transporter Mla maintaining outer membrane lipid asymmetry ATPase subunit MlaF